MEMALSLNGFQELSFEHQLAVNGGFNVGRFIIGVGATISGASLMYGAAGAMTAVAAFCPPLAVLGLGVAMYAIGFSGIRQGVTMMYNSFRR